MLRATQVRRYRTPVPAQLTIFSQFIQESLTPAVYSMGEKGYESRSALERELMKKMMVVSLVAALVGVAGASEYELQRQNRESSYSFQSSTKTQVTRRQRHIPAPTSWTPPERVPSPRVTMVRRDQPKRLGGGFGFSSPSFSSPSFSSPGFSSPGFSSPGFSSPGFGSPGFSSPGFSNPGFSNPGYSNPGTVAAPGYSNPSL